MVPVEISYNLDHLRNTLRRYGELSGKTEAEVIQKQSEKLGYNIYAGMRKLAPSKGSVRSERLAALKAGGGIHVRPGAYASVMKSKGGSVYDDGSVKFFRKFKTTSTIRGLNFQALAVQRELTLRETGRGFSAWSTPKAKSYAEILHTEQDSRYGQVLSLFDLDIRPEAQNKFSKFTWDTGSPALQAMNQSDQMNVLNAAILDTDADIMVYINRKISEDINSLTA